MRSLKSVFKNIVGSDRHWKLNVLDNWATIVGTMSNYVSVDKIYEDTIVLTVVDSCWMQELYLFSDLLLKKINQNLDQPRIKHLRFKQLGVCKKKATVSKVVKKTSCKFVSLSSVERAALKKIKDPQLSSALEKFLIRCYQE